MYRLKEELENEKDFLIEVIKQLVNFISILTFTDKSVIKKIVKL